MGFVLEFFLGYWKTAATKKGRARAEFARVFPQLPTQSVLVYLRLSVF